jgi:hypothetical protein
MSQNRDSENSLAHALERLSANWSDLIPPAWLYVSCWLLILGAFILRVAIGAGGNMKATDDLFCFLDGGWRVLQGQVPYKDFMVDYGSFVHMTTALGLRLAHGRAEGVGFAQALMGLLLGAWAWAITHGRLRPLLRVLFCLNVVFVAIAPYLLGDLPQVTAPSGFYNRYGTALVALVMAEGIWGRDSETGRSRFWGGFSTGCAVALALFIKVTYFIGGAFLVAALIPCLSQTKQRWAGLAAGAAVTVLPFWINMGGTLMPMIKVLMQLAAARRFQINVYTIDTLEWFVGPLICFALVMALLRWHVGAPAESRNMMVATVAVSAAGMLFQLTNYPRWQFPLSPALAILLLQFLVSRRGDISKDNSRFAADQQTWTNALLVLLLASWVGILTIHSIVEDGSSLVYGMANKRRIEQLPDTSFHSDVLSAALSSETKYVARVNDGLDLVRSHLRPGDTVCALDYCNPFQYSLGLRPFPGGSSAGFNFGVDFTDASKPSPEYVMGGASIVMLPEVFINQNLILSMPRIYGPYLHAHFHLEARSQHWRLYRHNE